MVQTSRTPGSWRRPSAYEVTGLLGEGGMGAVYRARDTKLNREVALKILPELFASDPDRLDRVEREATTLAALNHPHIAQIHHLEQHEQTSARAPRSTSRRHKAEGMDVYVLID